MSNSPLVKYTKISPNKTSPRNSKIDTITIHCIVGQLSVETLGNVFAPTSRQASSNYGVGADGRIGMYVEEKDRSWCSSSGANDHRAVTIEVASDLKHPYAVTDVVYKALIELVADICKRNDIKELKWKADKSLIGQVDKQNMTVHRWFSNTACPGDYLFNKMGQIAIDVNAKMKGSTNTVPPVTSDKGALYRVQVGAYSVLSNAKDQEKKLKSKGFDTYLVKVGNLYKVQVGAYSVKANADTMVKKIKTAGFDCFITTEVGEPVKEGNTTPVVKTVEVGSKVKVKNGAKSYTGGSVASFVYNGVYVVDELKGDRAVLDKKGIHTPFNIKDLIAQ